MTSSDFRELDFLVVSNVPIGTTLPSLVIKVDHAHELPLKFILKHAENLPRNIIFISDDDGSAPLRPHEIPYLESQKFLLDWLNSPTQGYMSFDPRPLGPVRRISAFMRLSGFWDAIMLHYFGKLSECHDFTNGRSRGTRFVVSRKLIYALPLAFWWDAYEWVQKNRLPDVRCEAEDIDPCAAWYIGQYLECVWPLVFTAAPETDRSLHCGSLSAMYGADRNCIDVTSHIFRHLVVRDCKNVVLWIPQQLDFNALFRVDPCPGTEKILTVTIDDKILCCHERNRTHSEWAPLTTTTIQ